MLEDIHVVPVGDLIEHDSFTQECVCGPQAKLIETENGDRWIFVHNSLDGREFSEPDHAANDVGSDE